ncbi:MAG TPA: PAS domain-containing protein, partial [Methanospirillum sp.]|nr:PAS domain-containing protein [Methanospirillum sp.]
MVRITGSDETLMNPGVKKMEMLFLLFGIVLFGVSIPLICYLKKIVPHEDFRHYAKIIESAPFPAVISNLSDNTILMINGRASEMLGILPQDMAKNNLFDFFVHPENRDELIHSLNSQGN